jgi:hypothetical protein
MPTRNQRFFITTHPNQQDTPNVARRSTLWATTELPIGEVGKQNIVAVLRSRDPKKGKAAAAIASFAFLVRRH